MKILIVDDDPAIITLYKTELELGGHKVSTAVDGEEGWRKVQAEKPEVVLLDISMPKMDGIAVLEKIKGTPETRKTIVIMLTNFGQDEYIKSAFGKDADSYALKYKMTPLELRKQIEELGKKTGWEPAE